MFRFLHAADLHLDSPLRGLERYPGAPVELAQDPTRRALVKLVDLALAERVAFVILAGDLFDGDWDDYHTGLFFAREIARLREAGIPVYVLAGNHDAQSRLTKSLRWPDHVHTFATDEPQSYELSQYGVCLHGQGFATQAERRDLAAGYPLATPGHLNIGVLHTSLTGAEGHERYAPCTIEGLVQKGYDYWALGHVHGFAIRNERPWVVYAGSLQGRMIREAGPKGAVLVTVDQGQIQQVEHRATDVFRYERCLVDAQDAADADEVLHRVRHELVRLVEAAEGRPLAVRIEFSGTCPAHAELAVRPQHWVQQLRVLAAHDARVPVWVERVEWHTRPPIEHDPLAWRDGPLAELRALVTDLGSDEAMLTEAKKSIDELVRKLPMELAEGPLALGVQSPAEIDQLMQDAAQFLAQRLITAGGPA